MFKKIFFEKSAQSDIFKEMWVPILKGLKHPNSILLETNSFQNSAQVEFFKGYATNGHIVPL